MWSHDEWFTNALGEDQELADAVSDAKAATGGDGDSLDPMADDSSSLDALRDAARAKGLYIE